MCGVDYSTIKRHRERFPGVRRRDDVNGTYEIPVEDLVAAGLWRPDDSADVDVDAVIGRTRTEHRVEELVLDHADFSDEWFQNSVVERWRNGEALIPSRLAHAGRLGCGC